MLKRYHIELTQAALEGRMSGRALQVVLRANTAQDSLAGLLVHPEYHFDGSDFEAGNAYLTRQADIVRKAVASRKNPERAWRAFGRICHSVQDFYAHSNYIALWQAGQPDRPAPAPEQIEPLEPEIMSHPALRSGKVYYPLEALTYFPLLTNLVRRWLPKDSHAWMNLDSPKSGERFPYALVAARRRTRHEFDILTQELHRSIGASAVRFFTGAGP